DLIRWAYRYRPDLRAKRLGVFHVHPHRVVAGHLLELPGMSDVLTVDITDDVDHLPVQIRSREPGAHLLQRHGRRVMLPDDRLDHTEQNAFTVSPATREHDSLRSEERRVGKECNERG